MNQCANAGTASLERCKRMAQSPLSRLHSVFLSILLSCFPCPLANCYLSLTIAAVSVSHSSLTHLFFPPDLFLVILPFIPPCYFVLFILCAVYCSLVASVLLPASLFLQFHPPCGLSDTYCLYKKGGERKKKKR